MNASRPRSRRAVILRRSGLTLATLALLFSAALVTSTGCLASFGARPDPAKMASLAKTSRYEEERFRNVLPPSQSQPGFGTMMEFFFTQAERTPPGPLPMEDPQPIWATPPAEGLRVTWLGHSTLLIEIDGRRVLTDPIWGERASPSTILGPRRFHPPVVPLGALPPLDAVVISHDHYDHLDMPTIEALAKRGVRFYVPLGVAAHLEKWGVPRSQLEELDWWEERTVAGTELTLVSTPSRHFSGRGLTGRDGTLWTSWVIRTPQHRVYFSGDTGLTPQFEEIRERQGPFDLVMLEVGAFHPSWGDIHLGPDNALKAHAMLGGGPFLPIHWGTFNLGLHAWDDPPRQLEALAKAKAIPMLTPRLGRPVEVSRTGPTPLVDSWWREVKHGGSSELADVPSF